MCWNMLKHFTGWQAEHLLSEFTIQPKALVLKRLDLQHLHIITLPHLYSFLQWDGLQTYGSFWFRYVHGLIITSFSGSYFPHRILLQHNFTCCTFFFLMIIFWCFTLCRYYTSDIKANFCLRIQIPFLFSPPKSFKNFLGKKPSGSMLFSLWWLAQITTETSEELTLEAINTK